MGFRSSLARILRFVADEIDWQPAAHDQVRLEAGEIAIRMSGSPVRYEPPNMPYALGEDEDGWSGYL